MYSTYLGCYLLEAHFALISFINDSIFLSLQSRLQFFALAIQGYIRKLKEFVAGKSKSELASEENQLKLVALRYGNISFVWN